MIVRTGTLSKIAAWLLGTTNFIVMVFCLLWFALSLWMVASPSTLWNIIQQYGDTTLKALLPLHVLTIQNGVGFSSLAVFLFFVALMGFYGAISRSQFLLFMYSTLILLMLLLECALTYYFSSSLIEKGLQETDGQWTHALRLLFRCCDFKNTTLQDTLKPPWSCCGSDFYPDNCTAVMIHDKDCQATISSWIDSYIAIVYTLLAALHVVLSSCSIMRRSRYVSRSHS